MSMTAAQLVAHINAIRVGEMDVIRGKLGEARRACLNLSRDDLAQALTEAETALDQADMRTYRKRVETVVARLGHLK